MALYMLIIIPFDIWQIFLKYLYVGHVPFLSLKIKWKNWMWLHVAFNNNFIIIILKILFMWAMKKKTVEFRDIFMLEENIKGEIENQVKLAALYRTNINTLYLSIFSAILFFKNDWRVSHGRVCSTVAYSCSLFWIVSFFMLLICWCNFPWCTIHNLQIEWTRKEENEKEKSRQRRGEGAQKGHAKPQSQSKALKYENK